MRKLLHGLLIFLLTLSSISSAASSVLADTFNADCGPQHSRFDSWATSADYSPQQPLATAFTIKVNFDTGKASDYNYYVRLLHPGTAFAGIFWGETHMNSDSQHKASPATFNFPANGDGSNTAKIGAFSATLMYGNNNDNIGPGVTHQAVCDLGTMTFVDAGLNNAQCNIKMPDQVKTSTAFSFNVEKNDPSGLDYRLYFFKTAYLDTGKLPHGAIEIGQLPDKLILAAADIGTAVAPFVGIPLGISASSNSSFLFDNPIFAYLNSRPPDNTYAKIHVPANTNSGTNPGDLGWTQVDYSNDGNNNFTKLEEGDYVAVLEIQRVTSTPVIGQVLTPTKLVSYCSMHTFSVNSNTVWSISDPNSPANPTKWTSGAPITPLGKGGVGGADTIAAACADPSVCSQAAGTECTNSSGTGPGIQTAIGCIHTSPAEFVKDFMTFAVGLSGGMAFLMMLLGAFQMLTSGGNPESLAGGRDRFTDAIIGLLLVIFAVLLLQIIGVDILHIPGFTRN